MKLPDTRFLAVMLTACLTVPVTSFADDAVPHHMGGPMDGHPMGGGMMNREAMQEMLHTRLKLRADQEDAWKTFTNSTKQPRSMPDNPVDWDKLNTPQRAEKMLELSKKHIQNMESNIEAMKTFYAVLTPEQQQIFDDFHSSHMSRMHQHMQHRGMPGMGMKNMPANR